MLHLRMNMPFVLMAFYGSLMILLVLFFRGMLKNRLPKFVFPVLWCVVLLRLLVPFSLSSPLTLKATAGFLPFSYVSFNSGAEYMEEEVTYMTPTPLSGTGDKPLIGDLQSSEEIGTVVVQDVETAYEGGAGGDSFFSAPYSGFGPVFRLLPYLYYIGIFTVAGIFLLQKCFYAKRLKNRLLIEHNETINQILREMNMGHILVFTNDEIASPLVCGLITPKIYLPTRMEFQNAGLLRHIFTHEIMHIKRRDNWVKLIMLVALVLHWYNPLVWLMGRYLSSDLETACDEAVLGKYKDEDERKGYAFSLLAMAVTGNRTTMLYSAFSKTEVERRIQNILRYKKTSVFLLASAVLFLVCSTTVFATAIQAPFSSCLTSYCSSSNSRWGARIYLTRDIALGKNHQKRAEEVVFDVLRTDVADDPERIEDRIRERLAEEFHVEKSAFRIDISLLYTEEERKAEWESYGIIEQEDGWFSYHGEQVRVFKDPSGFIMSREEGTVDIIIQRSRYGELEQVLVLREGDSEFDRRSAEIERERGRRGEAFGVINNEAVQPVEDVGVSEYR